MIWNFRFFFVKIVSSGVILKILVKYDFLDWKFSGKTRGGISVIFGPNSQNGLKKGGGIRLISKVFNFVFQKFKKWKIALLLPKLRNNFLVLFFFVIVNRFLDKKNTFLIFHLSSFVILRQKPKSTTSAQAQRYFRCNRSLGEIFVVFWKGKENKKNRHENWNKKEKLK